MQVQPRLTAIEYRRGCLSIIDQLKLPDQFFLISVATVDDAWKAIHTMSIGGKESISMMIESQIWSLRGASAIALCGVLSVAVELDHARSKFDSISAVEHFVTDQLSYLITARPAATNMANAAKTIIDYLMLLNEREQTVTSYINALIGFIEEFLPRDLAVNRAIGRNGAEMLSQTFVHQKKLTILTHGNTGSLATVGFGTALGVIRQLVANSLLQLVYFTETRPFNQGSRLTAFELVHDRIPQMMICDSMVGLLMRTHLIHAVLVGAHCITVNGDTVDQIGTYQLAILAHYHQIPFYVAAPTASIDWTKRSGDAIIIEQRPSSEVTTARGVNIAAEGN